MKILSSLWELITKKRHRVSFAGRDFTMWSSRWKKPSTSPQQFIEKHGVICANCASLMLPGEKIWLVCPVTDGECTKPGVMRVGEGKERALVGCLAWGCPPTAAVMCGELLEDRKIQFFESPISKALRTDDVVVVSDVSAYRG